jgi:hypothetical protein
MEPEVCYVGLAKNPSSAAAVCSGASSLVAANEKAPRDRMDRTGHERRNGGRIYFGCSFSAAELMQ